VELTLDHGACSRDASGDSVGKALYRALKSRKASDLRNLDLRMLPQLLIVKTNTSTILRHESSILNRLHSEGGKNNEDLIGSLVVRAQFTCAPESSWLALHPVFGCTLQQFGNRCIDTSDTIPSWFFWHMFSCLMDALEHVHAKGVAHGDISAENTMLNLYPTQGKHRFRDYPNVVLIDFEKATNITDRDAAEDVWSMLLVVQQVAKTWSDWAQVRPYIAAGALSDDPLAVFELEVADFAYGSSVQDVKNKWAETAVTEREKGPLHMPTALVRNAHDDLATEDEMIGARKVILNQFGSKLSGFRWFIRGHEPISLGDRELVPAAEEALVGLEGAGMSAEDQSLWQKDGTSASMEEHATVLVEGDDALQVREQAPDAGEYASRIVKHAMQAGHGVQLEEYSMQTEMVL
jgi:hypothetical protein